MTSTSPGLPERLRARYPEIEQAALARVCAISDPGDVEDSRYASGLRESVTIALDYSVEGIETAGREFASIPDRLLAQARAAARNGVSLAIVLRRYLAGYTLLGDFIAQEIQATGAVRYELRDVLGVQAALLDRLIAEVAEEYQREADRQARSIEGRRVECVERLLAGDPSDTSRLAYDFTAHHLGAVAAGPDIQEALREIARSLDCRVLLIAREEGTLWAWLGSGGPLDHESLTRAVAARWPPQAVLATGEPAEGLTGWRLTHRQAAAALSIAARTGEPHVRYADVALQASISQDEVLSTSLRDLYLVPLTEGRDGGATLRRTLRAFFAADRNVSSAAAALGVTRKTVNNRLRTVEERLGRTLSTCALELETTLRLERLSLTRVPDVFPPGVQVYGVPDRGQIG